VGPLASRPASHAKMTEMTEDRRRMARWKGRRRRSLMFLVRVTSYWRNQVEEPILCVLADLLSEEVLFSNGR